MNNLFGTPGALKNIDAAKVKPAATNNEVSALKSIGNSLHLNLGSLLKYIDGLHRDVETLKGIGVATGLDVKDLRDGLKELEDKMAKRQLDATVAPTAPAMHPLEPLKSLSDAVQTALPLEPTLPIVTSKGFSARTLEKIRSNPAPQEGEVWVSRGTKNGAERLILDAMVQPAPGQQWSRNSVVKSRDITDGKDRTRVVDRWSNLDDFMHRYKKKEMEMV